MTELNGKIASESKHMLNPFVHKLELNNPIDIIRTIIFTVLLLPLRIFGIFVCLIIAWIFACIGLYGLTLQDISAKPLIGWRRKCRDLSAVAMRSLFWCGSFLNIKIKGRHATVNEAPILVVAPHSSFCDAIAVIMLGAPAVVAKAETATLPIFGKLINFAQPIYVWRDDPNSRQNTIKGIIERAKSKDDWTQILIFPEGTCTNRSCLITFKQGAFYPGVPVQPVCIRYPNKLDSTTWTWEGPGVLKLLWLTLTQLQNFCEIEFLPVYIPNDEEKMDPKLFAKNVRKVMANAHAIPVSDYTYDDCKIMVKAKDRNMPYAADIVDIEKLRQQIGLSQTNIEEQLVTSNLVNDSNCNINLSEFLLKLKISTEDNKDATQQLFSIFSKDNTGFIDFRDYLLYALLLITKKKPLIELIYLLSKMHHNGKFSDRITKESLYQILRYTLTVTLNETNLIFEQIDKTKQGYIAYDELKNYLRLKPKYSYVFKYSRK